MNLPKLTIYYLETNEYKYILQKEFFRNRYYLYRLKEQSGSCENVPIPQKYIPEILSVFTAAKDKTTIMFLQVLFGINKDKYNALETENLLIKVKDARGNNPFCSDFKITLPKIQFKKGKYKGVC